MEKLAIEAGCWSRPRCSKDTCSEILPGFGAGIQSRDDCGGQFEDDNDDGWPDQSWMEVSSGLIFVCYCFTLLFTTNLFFLNRMA